MLDSTNHPDEGQEDELAWYCVRTRPKQEKISAQTLRADVGVEVFSPFVRFKRSRGKGTMWVTEALFPGYVFSKFRYVEQMRHIQSSRGVTKILSFGGCPAIVPEDVIQAVRDSMPTEEEIVVIPDVVQPGDEVKIVAGPVRGNPHRGDAGDAGEAARRDSLGSSWVGAGGRGGCRIGAHGDLASDDPTVGRKGGGRLAHRDLPFTIRRFRL